MIWSRGRISNKVNDILEFLNLDIPMISDSAEFSKKSFAPIHCKYVQWNYSEDTTKNCKTELQFFYCNMDKYFAIHSTMQKCRFKFTVITLHLEQQSNVKNTVKNCKLDYSYSTVLCTFLSCVPYLQCTWNWLVLKVIQKNIASIKNSS